MVVEPDEEKGNCGSGKAVGKDWDYFFAARVSEELLMHAECLSLKLHIKLIN